MLSPSLQICRPGRLRGLLYRILTGRRRRRSCGPSAGWTYWRGGTDAAARQQRCTVAIPWARPDTASRPGPPDTAHARGTALPTPTRLRGGCVVRLRAAPLPPPDTAGRSPPVHDLQYEAVA